MFEMLDKTNFIFAKSWITLTTNLFLKTLISGGLNLSGCLVAVCNCSGLIATTLPEREVLRPEERPLVSFSYQIQYWRLFFKGSLQYFSISSETTLDRNSNSFSSFSWRFKLVLPSYFVCVRQPGVTGKPEVNRKKFRTVRWFDIFIFPNMPYQDVKRWFYTQNDAFNLILKSDFD